MKIWKGEFCAYVFYLYPYRFYMNKSFPSLFLVLLTTGVFSQKTKTETSSSQSVIADNFKGLAWRNIGPFRGGRANTISGVIQDPNIYYAGYTGGGVWKTEDAGYSWKNISDGYFTVGTIGDIAVSESDPNVIYAGTGEHAIRGVMTSYGDGVYKSIDAGKTWKNIGLEKTRHIADVVVDPRNPDMVLVGAQGPAHGASPDRGVYKSTDGGTTWKKTLFVDENTGVSSLSMDMTNPRVVYAATWKHRRYPWKVESGPGSAVWKSVDAGETWTKIVEGLPKEMGKIGVSVSRANPNRVFAIVEAAKPTDGLYRSDDGGKKWVQMSSDPVITARSWYYMEVFADPTNADIVYALNAPILRSIDGGKTFEDLKDFHGDNHDLWINPKNNKNLALAEDGGGCVSFNYGKAWSTFSNQPTAQFYRVNADNRMPFWVYGGQQDNLSVAIPSRTNSYGITIKDWFDGPGCESAAIAFDDPNNPMLLYGGCYQGQISVQDLRTREIKDIMEYPSVNEGVAPKNMKYRFNWNSPLINSPHDPKTMYHAGNVLFKTTNGGMNWTPISPDLTRNDSTKQDNSGGPITNEGAGGENYNTIYYVIESTLEKGTIYTGSDCGLVHVTRDEGKTWSNITPAGLPECMIHSIEVSPTDKGTVYIAASRYKFNDFSNMTYKSTDYGKTWTKIGAGVQVDDFIKVMREDVKVKDIVYAGAERGFYISFNGGRTFDKLQLNFPVVPITDLIIRNNDLVASTAGRSFWVFDDLSPFQQSKGAFGNTITKLYQPKPTVRIFSSSGFFLLYDQACGKNPAEGVGLDYYLSEKADTAKVTLEIMDASGTVIRKMTNQKDTGFKSYVGGPAERVTIPSNAGINRFAWDFRTEPLPDIQGVFVYAADYRGHRVAPGHYKARVRFKGESSEVEFDILNDPKVNATTADWNAQQQLIIKAEDIIRDAHGSVNSLRKVRRQVQSLNDAFKSNDAFKELMKAGEELIKKIDAWESRIAETRAKGFQDALNWPGKFNSNVFKVRSGLDTHDPHVPGGYSDRLNDLQGEWSKHKRTLTELLNKDVGTYNRLVKDKNVPALITETKDPVLNN